MRNGKSLLRCRRFLNRFKVTSKQPQGAGISGKRSTSGGFNEYFEVIKMLLDHFELTIQGVVIEENQYRITEKVHLLDDMDAITRRLLKIYVKLGWRKLND